MPYRIEKAHIRDLKLVKPYWKAMLRTIRATVGDQWPVRETEASWQLCHQDYLTWLNEGTGVVFLARGDDDEVAGYAALHFLVSGPAFDTGERYALLETLIVGDDHRGNGVGTKLLQACRDELSKREITYWAFDTMAADRVGRQLYHRAGFTDFVLGMVQNVESQVKGADALAHGPTGGVPGQAAEGGPTGQPPATGPAGAAQAAPSGPTPVAAQWERTTSSAAAPGWRPSDSPTARRIAGGDRAGAADPPGQSPAPDPEVRHRVEVLATAAHQASKRLALLSRSEKDAAIRAMAEALQARAEEILNANALDMQRATAAGMVPALQDRLMLDEGRLAAIAAALREVASFPDPVGELIRGSTMPNGVEIREVRVPLGVIGMIYEARPNVTVDAAGLCLKSGNAVVLRGGSAAAASNRSLVEVLRQALADSGLPQDAVCLFDERGRDAGLAILRARGLIDVVIPRGGPELVATVIREATVPVIETGNGNVHVYIDAAADLEKARAIVLNAKTQRPGVYNAAETLLVHESVADEFLPVILRDLADRGVVLHGDQRTQQVGAEAGIAVEEADEADYATEYLSLEMAVRVVENLDEALDHVGRFSTKHTEAIVTEDRAAARRWVAEVDAAVAMVNVSTRFTDGGEFGFGAEIGISTQKLHARGPMALSELTSTKWIVEGDGQVRG